MAKRIQYYELGCGGVTGVTLPAGAQVLAGAWLNGEVHITALVDDVNPTEVRDFLVVNENHRDLRNPGLRFITIVNSRWHIFEVPQPPAMPPPPAKEPEAVRHLWEMQPPDPCEDQNFHHNTSQHFFSWLDFMEDWKSWDNRMAYLFRWDWVPPRAGDEDDSPIQWARDEHYRESKLRLFFVFGGRGIYSVNTVSVCRADEPSIRGWLVGRYEHLLANWGGAVDIVKTAR